MTRTDEEVKRAKQARAAHARAVRAANKEKRERLKANRLASIARARANKAATIRLVISRPTLLRNEDEDEDENLMGAVAA